MVNKVLKFLATWCAPCRALGETLSKVEDVTIENVDVDNNEELCEKYNIRSVPTLIFLNNENKEVGRSVGNISLDSFYNKLKELNEK